MLCVPVLVKISDIYMKYGEIVFFRDVITYDNNGYNLVSCIYWPVMSISRK